MNIAGTAGSAQHEAPSRAAGMASVPRGYIPGFDGLRAIAVLMVLVSHVGYGGIVPGGLGVTIFFAISGFLITTLLIDEFAAAGTIDLKRFYARRILRLYPELLALMIACLIAGAALGLHATMVEVLAVPFYYMNYYYVFGVHQPLMDSYPWRQLWSLAIEEHFYLVFPAIILFTGNSRRWRLGIVLALIALPFFWRFVTYHVLDLPWQYNYVATDTRIDSIAWGCLLAILMRREDGPPEQPRRFWFVRPAAVPLAIVIMLVSLLIRSEDFRWTWRFTLQGIAIVLLIANLLFDPRWRAVVAGLEWRPLRYIGRISYGLYLYHMLVNRVIEQFAPGSSPPVLLSLSLPITFFVAAASFHTLETPLKGVRRRLGSHVR